MDQALKQLTAVPAVMGFSVDKVCGKVVAVAKVDKVFDLLINGRV